ncbi:MAG: hypothetical protein RRA94_10365 [Bacteroidota bacterium]|nr:hypothetical protein [Bacteroidota bacterium]
MATLQNVLLLVLSVGGIVLIVILTVVLLRIARLLQQVSDDVRRIGDETVPTLKRLQQVADRMDEALTVVTDNRASVTRAVDNIRNVTENIYRLESILHEQLEPAVTGIAQRLAGLRKGFDTFLATLRKRR